MQNSKIQFSFLLAALLIGVASYHWIGLSLKNFKAGDVGLGVMTTSHDAFWEQQQISQSHGDMDKVLPTLKKFKAQNHPTVLITGNSQLHSINEYQEGNQLAVYYANLEAQKNQDKLRYVQLSSPNINLHELLVYYLNCIQHQNIPAYLAIGVPYRSFHLAGLREAFAQALQTIDLTSLDLPEDIQSYYQDYQQAEETVEAITPTSQTPQDQLESYLVEELEENWQAYRYRGNVRSKLRILPGHWYQQLFVEKYELKGTDFTINQNIQFLKALFAIANQHGTQILVYQPPHPEKESKMDYDHKDYLQFFAQLEKTCAEFDGVKFERLDKIVPVEYWGMNNRGWLDIFHFKNEGHQILGKALHQNFSTRLTSHNDF